MSEYTQSVDFSAKDALTTGDPNKKIQGADLDTELAAISTAIASKSDTAADTHTGTHEFSGTLNVTGVLTADYPLLAGTLNRPILSLGTDTDHDIDITAGAIPDSTGKYMLNLSSTVTKKVDATWAEGDDLGGRASGFSLPSVARTTVHVFLIGKIDGTVDAGFDSSLTATNLLADATGYTLYRRIGSLLLDASDNWLAFTQFGNRFYVSPYEHTSLQVAATPSYSTRDVGCPKGIDGLHAILGGEVVMTSSGKLLAAYEDDRTYKIVVASVTSTSFTTVNTVEFPVNASGQVAYQRSGTHSTTALDMYGWVDNLDLG